MANLPNNLGPARLFGMAMMVLGVAGWWYNNHLATTEGEFWIKLCVFTPLAVAGGLLMALRPEWAGPWQSDSAPGQKMAVAAVVVFMAVGSGVEFFRLQNEVNRRAPRQHVIAWSPEMGRPKLPVAMASMSNMASMPTREAADAPQAIPFLGRQYRLGSYNERHSRMWEFVTGGETVQNWTTLLTLVERPDARTREDLDRLSEGLLTAYRSRGGKVLLARTMGKTPETVYNYAVVAFEQPKENRYELNFVKMQLGPQHAAVAVYGVRVADPRDYQAKGRAFLDAHSNEIGLALEGLALPNLAGLPRREF